MSQIALPLDARAAAGPARIVAAGTLAPVVEALRDPARWPYRSAVLVGPPRAGKSLLARWFAHHGHGEAIDDAGLAEEAALFHAWNRAQEAGRPLLLTARPGWQVALPDLASRLGGSLHLAIPPPDDALVEALLAAHAEQRGLALGAGAIPYLAPRVERSHAAIEAVVAAVDRISLERQAPVTMSVLRDALDAVQGPRQARLF